MWGTFIFVERKIYAVFNMRLFGPFRVESVLTVLVVLHPCCAQGLVYGKLYQVRLLR
jgi:hypothetical protein